MPTTEVLIELNSHVYTPDAPVLPDGIERGRPS